MNFLKGRKTVIIAILTLIYAWLGYGLGYVTIDSAIELTSIALVALGLRAGIAGK